MGRKGVSKHKQKKSKPLSNIDISGSSTTRSGERPFGQPLLQNNGSSLNRSSMNPSAGSNKQRQKGN